MVRVGMGWDVFLCVLSSASTHPDINHHGGICFAPSSELLIRHSPHNNSPWKVVRLPGFQAFPHHGGTCFVPTSELQVRPHHATNSPGRWSDFQVSTTAAESALCPLRSFKSGLATQHEPPCIYQTLPRKQGQGPSPRPGPPSRNRAPGLWARNPPPTLPKGPSHQSSRDKSFRFWGTRMSQGWAREGAHGHLSTKSERELLLPSTQMA